MTTLTVVLLRPLEPDDFEDFCDMNADEKVMRFFPSALTREQSQSAFEKIQLHYENYGFSYWAVEVDGKFAGITGLLHSSFETPMGPHVEIGWRLMPWAWGHGYVSLAAREALRRGFDEFHLKEIFSYTTSTNEKSENVMKRIGMERCFEFDFEHPNTPGWWGQRHIVYRISKS